MDSRYYVLTMGSARSHLRGAAWRTALTCLIAASLWSGQARIAARYRGGRCHDENVEGSTPTAGFGRGRLPVVLRAPMFVVSEAEAAAIRTAFDRGGELSAAVELG
jgi:hypothetical protein